MSEQHTNSLINETSLYLRQHAHNPVNWNAWNHKLFKQAQKENKLVLISIGYSACHWCHVMEKECFEDTNVAQIMNDNFINIKVDREEHPDVDQMYMNAVNLMTGNGGWPLNVIALPDGSPVYGGTYFPKDTWVKILQVLADGYKSEPDKFYQYAKQLANELWRTNLLPKAEQAIEKTIIDAAINHWQELWDDKWGGNNWAPKFPMPVNLNFLLDYSILSKNEEIKDFLFLTLNKIAQGGIYDHIGGGFMRYSTDIYWKVPHFEKMLYDNAQLIGIYAKAYSLNKKPLYKSVVEQTIAFLLQDFKANKGGFYATMDADSEGVEGKYYTWTIEELKNTLANDEFEFAKQLFALNPYDEWEGKYIIWHKTNLTCLAKDFNISVNELLQKKQAITTKLLNVRKERIKPATDIKIITSWNALLVSGLVQAGSYLLNGSYIKEAEALLHFIENYLIENYNLFHVYDGKKAKIFANLDDYAFLIRAYLDVYQVTFNVHYVLQAELLTKKVKEQFSDSNSEFFYFTSRQKNYLAMRQKELSDNVTPSSNAIMTHNLSDLALIFSNTDYEQQANEMLRNIQTFVANMPSAYACWAQGLLRLVYPFKEIVLLGEKCLLFNKELHKNYFPNVLFAGSEKNENLPILENRLVKNKTFIYLCENKTCLMPVETLEAAKEQILADI